MAPPKKGTIQAATPTTESRIVDAAQKIWNNTCMVKPTAAKFINAEGKHTVEGQTVITPTEAYKLSLDNAARFMEELRKVRDAAKPVQRAQREVDEVLKDSIGKSLGDLQAAFIRVPISGSGDTAVVDRMNIPTLRRYAESDTHPLHNAATAFMAAHKLKFTEQAKSGPGKGKVVLEKMAA